MGHHTEVETISATHAESLTSRAEPAYSGYGYRQTRSLHELVLEAGISRWRDESAGRWDSENVGPLTVAPITPDCVAGRRIDSPYDESTRINSGRSIVVPIASEADTVRSTRTVRLTASPELAELSHTNRHSHALMDALAEELKGDPSLSILNVEKIELVKAPRRLAPRAEATPGKLVTVYELVAAAGGMFGSRVVGRAATLSEARAAGTDYMAAHPECVGVDVRAAVVRESDDGTRSASLARISRPAPKNPIVELRVTFAHAKKGAKASDYLVAFDVHS